MDFKFVLALIIAIIVAVFAIQNAGAVDISFITMEFSISQALVILISAVFGAFVAAMLSLVRRVRQSVKIKGSAKTITALETEVNQLKQKLEAKIAEEAKAAEAAKVANQNQSSGETV